MIDILIQRNIAGHRRGDVISVHPDDARYAGHILAGNAIELVGIEAPLKPPTGEPAFPLDDLPDDLPKGAAWIHPDEDYGQDPED